MAKFSQTEVKIRGLFAPGETIDFEGTRYIIEESAKPRPASGECKTDLYVRLRAGDSTRELKISIKQANADFLENKIQYERAKEIFGEDVDTVLKDSINSIKEKFLDQYLVAFDKFGKTYAKTIKLGWKFEFVNKPGGELSGKLALSHEQLKDIYCGNKLPESKRNARVNDRIVEGSGVADYILFVDPDGKYDLKQCVGLLTPIDKYLEQHPNIFFACKALNYRLDDNKWDGDRPLGVYVDWSLADGTMTGKLNFDHPLQKKGNEIGNNVKEILSSLKVSKENFRALKTKLSREVKYYEAVKE